MIYQLTVSYDGTHYFGWQKTRQGPSIQETLESALKKVTGETAAPEAASRTDRGVHATGQRIAFSLEKEWEPERLLAALNAVLPRDIRIQALEKASPSFHPTLQARGKEYHYWVCKGDVQDPRFRLYSWHFRRSLDLSLMEKGAKDLLGTHDFTAFANEEKENPICTLAEIAFIPQEKARLQISLKGDRFLYKMVRNIAGTLLYIGCGKLPPGCIPSLLKSRDRKQAGMTAPAHGLFLHRVEY